MSTERAVWPGFDAIHALARDTHTQMLSGWYATRQFLASPTLGIIQISLWRGGAASLSSFFGSRFCHCHAAPLTDSARPPKQRPGPLMPKLRLSHVSDCDCHVSVSDSHFSAMPWSRVGHVSVTCRSRVDHVAVSVHQTLTDSRQPSSPPPCSTAHDAQGPARSSFHPSVSGFP